MQSHLGEIFARSCSVVLVALATLGTLARGEEPDTVVRGTVVDEAGRPVAGATVGAVAQRVTLGVSAEVRSDPAGRFEVRLPGVVTHGTVRASVEGGDRAGVANVLRWPIREVDPVTVVLKPVRAVTARVVDAGGRPVAGATVRVVFERLGARDGATTDDRGEARFRLPGDLGVVVFLGFKDGVGADYFENYPSSPVAPGAYPAPPPLVTLRLDGARAATVEVSDGAGRPVADVQVGPIDLRRPGKVAPLRLNAPIGPGRTGPDGVARLGWLPGDGKAAIMTLSDRFASDQVSVVNPEEGRDVALSFKLVARAKLSGRVVGPDGSPAAGVLVQAVGQVATGSLIPLFAVTGPDGSYAVRGESEAAYLVEVIHPTLAAGPRSVDRAAEGEDRGGVDFRLGPGFRVHGRVVGPGKPAYVAFSVSGRPIPPQGPGQVVARLEQISHVVGADADGSYEAILGPGAWTISGPGREKPAKVVVVVAGPGDRAIDFEARPGPGPRSLARWRGRVVGPGVGPGGSRPVVGASVRLFLDDRAVSEARTDPAGRFDLDASTGATLIQIKDASNSLTALGEAKVGPGEPTWTLAPAASALGRAVHDGGRPIVGEILVRLVAGPGGAAWSGPLERDALDADGRYLVTGLIPGARYEARVAIHGGPAGLRTRVLQEFTPPGPGPIDLGESIVPGDR